MDVHIMKRLMSVAVQEAKQGYDEGGVPVGAVIATENGNIIAQGHNLHHQNGDPTSHGENQCVRHAGRRRDWSELTLVTTLSPCSMCSGTVVLLNFKRVVVGDRQSYHGKTEWIEGSGIPVVYLDDQNCIELMDTMLRERPELWKEDIGK